MSTATQTLTGRQLIGYTEFEGSASALRGIEPGSGAALPITFSAATPDQVEQACVLAAKAFPVFAQLDPALRAGFLEAIAEELQADRAAITARAHAETALPMARVEGELARTAGQLTLFAGVLRNGRCLRTTLDTADPGRKPLAKPALATVDVALGPVVVFAASNFPLAYSVAGGDTASALAAGCPVIVRAHPAHPGTAELVAQALLRAARRTGMPEGVFSLLTGPGNDLGAALVRHPAVAGVGFTGSRAGGLALAALAAARPVPVPFFAEMSSVNPVFVLPDALASRGAAIADGLVASTLQGVGQFCTSPGLVFGVAGAPWEAFARTAAESIERSAPATMLHAGIAAAYTDHAGSLASLPGVSLLAQGAPAGACQARAQLCRTTAQAFLQEPRMAAEVFGPASLLITCTSFDEMLTAATQLEGQLTASLHMTAEDYGHAGQLLPVLTARAGRLVANGFPTGLEVGYATVHGGPYPATTDSRFTAVGARAIERWLRPVCFQDFPEDLLPPALKASNPLRLPRLVDGEQSSR